MTVIMILQVTTSTLQLFEEELHVGQTGAYFLKMRAGSMEEKGK